MAGGTGAPWRSLSSKFDGFSIDGKLTENHCRKILILVMWVERRSETNLLEK